MKSNENCFLREESTKNVPGRRNLMGNAFLSNRSDYVRFEKHKRNQMCFSRTCDRECILWAKKDDPVSISKTLNAEAAA